MLFYQMAYYPVLLAFHHDSVFRHDWPEKDVHHLLGWFFAAYVVCHRVTVSPKSLLSNDFLSPEDFSVAALAIIIRDSDDPRHGAFQVRRSRR